MTELDLIYETSQQTDIESSILMEKIILYINREYKIRRITDYKIVIKYNFDRSSGLSDMSKSKRFQTILDGNFEVCESKISLNYQVDLLGLLIFFIILIVASLANPWGLLFSIPLIIQHLIKISILKNTSQNILKAITNNIDQPITTKFKSIRID